MNIAIVNSSSFGQVFPAHLKRLEKLGHVERFTFPIDIGGKELAEKLNGFEIIISSVTPFFKADFFAHKDKTLLISRHGIGYNNVDIPSATAAGTAVTIVSALVERNAVAENAASLLLTLVRQVALAAKAAKAGDWASRASFIGHELTGKTLGVIGFGNIGSRVGEILSRGFNMRLLACDPYAKPEVLAAAGATLVDLDTLLAESDVISLNSLLSPETYHMIGEAQIAKMKDGVYLVNTARGELADDMALIQAVKDGKIAGLAVDVVEGEPVGKDHPLFHHDRILVTPHTSAYTYECLEGMGEKVVADVENILSGKIPDVLINPAALGENFGR